MNLYLVVLLTILLHLAFAGSRVTLSLFAISLNASPFTVGLIMSLLAAVAFSKMDTPHHEYAAKQGEQRRLADLLRMPVLRRVFIVSGILSMAWDLFTFVTPIYGSSIGLSATAIGLILGAFGAAIFVVRLILPLVVHRVSEWKMMIGTMFATGATLAVFPLVNEALTLIGLAFILGVGLGGAQLMIMALLYNQAPPGRGGEAVGVRTLLLNFSQTSIPLLFGALGMAPAFWTMAAALLVGGGYARRGYNGAPPAAPKKKRPATALARDGRPQDEQ